MNRVATRVVNLEGVSERRPQDELRQALTEPGRFGLPDLLFLSEASNLDAHHWAERFGMHAIQYGERGSAAAGVAIISAVPLRPLRLKVGSRPVPGVRMRPIVAGRAYGTSWRAVHAPPRYTPAAHAAYLARARTTGGVMGGDWNEYPEWMRREFVRKYRGKDVLGVMVPRRFPTSRAYALDVGSDHPAVDVLITIPGGYR